MNIYDVALDFILLDAFDDLDDPPSTIVAVLQNRWITSGMKTSVSLQYIAQTSKQQGGGQVERLVLLRYNRKELPLQFGDCRESGCFTECWEGFHKFTNWHRQRSTEECFYVCVYRPFLQQYGPSQRQRRACSM